MREFRGFAIGFIAIGFMSVGGCLTLTTTGNTGGNGGYGATSSGAGLGTSGQPCMTVQDCPAVTTCTTMSCSDGSCVAGLIPKGTQCNGDKVCDGKGSCVECVYDSDCEINNGYCSDNTCVSCSDGEKNGDETGVDCGGPDCAPCSMACTSDADCAMGEYCADGVCCDTPCTDKCRACNLTGKQGTCSTLSKGTEDPGVCEMTKACAGFSGDCLLKNGQMCMQDDECVSNKCLAGICEMD